MKSGFIMQEKSKYEVKCRLKKGDQVIVIAGKNKGKTGSIDRIDKKNDRVYVGGVNMSKRHTKPSMGSPEGGIVEKVMPLHICKVSLVDPQKNKPTRVGIKLVDGKRVRFAKLSGAVLE